LIALFLTAMCEVDLKHSSVSPQVLLTISCMLGNVLSNKASITHIVRYKENM